MLLFGAIFVLFHRTLTLKCKNKLFEITSFPSQAHIFFIVVFISLNGSYYFDRHYSVVLFDSLTFNNRMTHVVSTNVLTTMIQLCLERFNKLLIDFQNISDIEMNNDVLKNRSIQFRPYHIQRTSETV